MSQSHRLATGGRIDRNQPLTFTFNGRDYPAFQGGHAGLRAAGQRRPPGGAEPEVPPSSRNRGRGRGGVQRAGPGGRGGPLSTQPGGHPGGALRRPAGPERQRLSQRRVRPAGRQRLVLAPDAARLLLQDLHVARGIVAAIRASDPQGRRFRGGAHGRRSRRLRPHERPLRRPRGGSRPCRPGRGPGGGTHRRPRGPHGRTERTGRRSGRERRPDRGSSRRAMGQPHGGRAGFSAGGPGPDPDHRGRLLRAQLPPGPGATDGSPAPGNGPRPASAALADPRQAGGAGHGRHRAAPGLLQQRSARRHAGLRGLGIHPPLCGPSRIPGRGLHQQRQRLPDGIRPAGRGRRGKSHRGFPAGRPAERGGAGTGPPGHESARRRRRPGRQENTGRPAHGAERRRRVRFRKGPQSGVRPPGRVRRLEPDCPAPRTIRRPARLRRRESLLRSGAAGASGAFGGSVPGEFRSPVLPHGRVPGRRGCCPSGGPRRRSPHAADPERRGQGRRFDPAALDRPGRQGPSLAPPSSLWILSWTFTPPTS